LIGSNTLSHHWDEVVASAVYLMNRMPSKVLDFNTPLQVLSKHVTLPSLLLIKPRIFGCVAFVHLHKNQRTKLELCVVRCIFLGYGTNKKGYRYYDLNKNRVYITMDVTFVESDKFYSSHISASSLQREIWDEEQKWWMGQIEETVVTIAPTVVTVAPSQEEETMVTTTPTVVTVASSQEETEAAITQMDENMVTANAARHIEEEAVTGTPTGTPSPVANNGLHEDIMVIDSDDESPSRRTPLLEVPDSDNPSPENIPEVRPSASPSSNVLDIATGYHLPFKSNRGKAPARYSPGEAGKKSKYPISNHMTTKGWSNPHIKFAQKLSSDHIPCRVHEALADHKWLVAIQEEMEALNRNRTWDLVPLPAGKKTMGCK